MIEQPKVLSQDISCSCSIVVTGAWIERFFLPVGLHVELTLNSSEDGEEKEQLRPQPDPEPEGWIGDGTVETHPASQSMQAA